MNGPNKHRAIWISDFHLGTRNTKADFLLDFLKANDSEYLYLVGDVIDGWALGKSWYWPQQHNDVIQKILRKARKGTRVTYIPGNHDNFARGFIDLQFGGIHTKLRSIHTTLDGRQLLVLHGDEFDGVIKYAQWLSVLGAKAYQLTLSMNRWYNVVRGWFDLPYWSLSAYLKQKAKRAVQHVANFEEAVATEALKYEVEGVVCGHIHHAEIRNIDGVLYCNAGDWVESCTALVEHVDGKLEIINWSGNKPESRVTKPTNREVVPLHGASMLPNSNIAEPVLSLNSTAGKVAGVKLS
ncbi:MAG: UDP-2,3-diacylglucosamine diphosphatase [Bacteroidota bacterium]